MEQMIFTACTGRCGQNSLGKYFNRFGKSCFAEMEPPDLIYKNHWPLGDWMRLIQRRWIVTHEDLGRGKALLWHDHDNHEKMKALANRRLKRAERVCKKNNSAVYIELSKFFIRSYCDHTFKLYPSMGVILLRRNPLMNARSFTNRNKNFALDGVMPDFKKVCFPIDINTVSKFQLYLWQWVEIELRYQRFVNQTGIQKHTVFKTEDLNEVEKVRALFQLFDIEEKEPIQPLKPVNTNVSQGKGPTQISAADVKEFYQFLEMIPPDIFNKVKYIETYMP